MGENPQPNEVSIEKFIQAQSPEKSINEILAALGTPFVSLAILEKGQITANIIGSSSSGIAKQINHGTLFQAASISKPLTALAVTKLCQEGKLDLDAPISGYLNDEQLSWLSTLKTLPLVSNISLRHLLSHTSGLSCHGFPGYATAEIPTTEAILRGAIPANNENITMSFLPGQGFHYSGGGFTVVQYILEVCLGKPFHQIMDETVLVPLGMTRSTYRFLPEGERDYAQAHINGKRISNPDHHFMPESAAAGLWTTPTDLLTAIKAVQKSLDADDFLERRWAQQMLTEVGSFGMGVGWRVEKGGVQFRHSGSNDPGYLSFVGGYADLPGGDESTAAKRLSSVPKGCGISVMTSSMLGMVVIEKITAAVAYLKNWPAIPEESNMVPFIDREKEVDRRAVEWVGEWGPGDWKLAQNEGFFIQFGKLPLMSLVTAACPPKFYEEGRSIDLVIDGLEVMLRLGWKEKSRIIEVWQDGDISTLERPK